MHFAEFLNYGYPDHLGILYPPTCVGLGYGHRVHSLEDFLGSMESVTSPIGSASCLRLHEVRIYLHLALHTYPRTTNAWAHLSSSVPPLLSAAGAGQFDPKVSPLVSPLWNGRERGGTGISTCCASTTPLGLALAPDLPWGD
jgi:hypothetical protein